MRPQSGFVQLEEEQFSQHGSRLLSITFKRRTNLFNTYGENGVGSMTPPQGNKRKKGCFDKRTSNQPYGFLPGFVHPCIGCI